MKRFCAALLASCVLVFALASCSGASKASDAESLKGFWELESSNMGFDAALNLDEEDLAELVMQDTYLEGTWTTDGTNATVTFEDAEPVTIYVSDGKLVYGSDEGSKFVFVKSDPDEYFESESSASDGSEVVEVDGDELTAFEDTEIVDEVIDDIKPVSVADDKICKIEVTGKGTDFTGDPGYRLSITNNHNAPIYLVADDVFKVDGKDAEAGLGEVVEPGETVETFMYLSADGLDSADKLKKVEGKIVVGNDDTSEDLETYTFKMD